MEARYEKEEKEAKRSTQRDSNRDCDRGRWAPGENIQGAASGAGVMPTSSSKLGMLRNHAEGRDGAAFNYCCRVPAFTKRTA